MSEPVIDAMSRELATARRWATRMAERVWQLEEGIRLHRGHVWITSEADYRLYALLEDDDV